MYIIMFKVFNSITWIVCRNVGMSRCIMHIQWVHADCQNNQIC